MPLERTRSLRWTREFLNHIADDTRLDLRFRERARIILAAYPTMVAIRARAEAADDWLAPDPKSDHFGCDDAVL